MKIDYDKDIDAIYIYFKKGKINSSKSVGSDFVVDTDKKNQIIGMEVLNASRYMDRRDGNLEVSIGKKKFSLAP